MDFRFTSMHRLHRIFSGDGWLIVLGIHKAARDHRRSQPLVQQRPVLIILCILCIDVQLWSFSIDRPRCGGRAPGSQANGSFPKGTGRLSEKSPASPPPHHRDDTPRERGRPARMLSLRLPLSFPAMLQPTALPAGTAWARPKQRQGAAAG